MLYTGYMDLSTAQQILVIVLASALAIFLILSIVAVALIIRLVATLRMVANKAEHVIESVESVGDLFKRTAGSFGIFKFLRGIVDTVHNHSKSSHGWHGKDKD